MGVRVNSSSKIRGDPIDRLQLEAIIEAEGSIMNFAMQRVESNNQLKELFHVPASPLIGSSITGGGSVAVFLLLPQLMSPAHIISTY